MLVAAKVGKKAERWVKPKVAWKVEQMASTLVVTMEIAKAESLDDL